MRKVETCTVTQLAHESDVDDVAQVSCLSLALDADLAVSVRRSLQPRIHALEAGSRKCTCRPVHDVEAAAALSMLVRRFDFEPP
jgi:hypothetical protein